MLLNEPFYSVHKNLPGDDVSENTTEAFRELFDIVGHPDYVSDAAGGITTAVSLCHGLAKRAGWWNDPATGEPKDRNDGEMIALMHSELSEALEGLRKNNPDDHLPHFKSVEVELADTLIRIFDFAGARGLNLAAAMVEKLAYNQRRADHKPAARLEVDGKKF